MNFIKKKLKGHKKDDEEEEYEKAVYEQSLHPQTGDQKMKNTEEWQFFQQLSMKVQDTVQKTQTTLNKLKDVRQDSFSEDKDPYDMDDELLSKDTSNDTKVPPYGTTRVLRAPPRPPPPAGDKPNPTTDSEFGSDFSHSLPAKGPPRPPPPGYERSSDLSFNLDSSALHGTPSKSFGSPARPPPPSTGRQEYPHVAENYPVASDTIMASNLAKNTSAAFSLLDEFGFKSDTSTTSNVQTNFQDLLFLDDKEETDPFDTSFVDVSNISTKGSLANKETNDTLSKASENSFNPFFSSAATTDDWMTASANISNAGTKAATNPFFTGMLDETKSDEMEEKCQSWSSHNPFGSDNNSVPISNVENDDFFGININPIPNNDIIGDTFQKSELSFITSLKPNSNDDLLKSDFIMDKSLEINGINNELAFTKNINPLDVSCAPPITTDNSCFNDVWVIDKNSGNDFFSDEIISKTHIEADSPYEPTVVWDTDTTKSEISFPEENILTQPLHEQNNEQDIPNANNVDFFDNTEISTSKETVKFENGSVFPVTEAKHEEKYEDNTSLNETSNQDFSVSKNMHSMEFKSDDSESFERKGSIPQAVETFDRKNSNSLPPIEPFERKNGIPQPQVESFGRKSSIPTPELIDQRSSILQPDSIERNCSIPEPPESIARKGSIPQSPESIARKSSIPQPPESIERKSSISQPPESIARKSSIPQPPESIARKSSIPQPPESIAKKSSAPQPPVQSFGRKSSIPQPPIELFDRKNSITQSPIDSFDQKSNILQSSAEPFDQKNSIPQHEESLDRKSSIPQPPTDIPNGFEFKAPESEGTFDMKETAESQFSTDTFSKPFEDENEMNAFLFKVKASDPQQNLDFDAFAAKFESVKESQGADAFDPFMSKRAPNLKKIKNESKGFGSMDEFDPFKVSRSDVESRRVLKKEISRDSFEDYDNEMDFSVVIKPKVKDVSDIKHVTMEPPKLLPPPKTPTKAFETSAPRFNPFDKDFVDPSTVAPKHPVKTLDFTEVEEDHPVPALGEAGVHKADSVDTPLSPLFDEDTSLPLEVFPQPYSKEGWEMVLRQPNKKKLTGNRFWKKIFVKLSDNSVLQLFNKDDDKLPFQELPLQACYSLSEVGAQQYDQYGKIFTVKLQYKFYRERVGVRPGQISKVTQGQVTSMGDVAKLGLPLQHSPQTSQLLKIGSQYYKDIKLFIQEIEDALFRMVVHRDRVLTYKTEEVQVIAQDEFYVEQSKTGHIDKQLARVRIFFLAFITGMPSVEVGLNDINRQGKEVVGRYDIIPVVTEEWIRLEDCEFHSCVNQDEFQKNRIIKFHPPDACLFELLRFRIRPPKNRELPLQVRVFMTVSSTRVEIRSDILVPGYSSRKQGQVPCENIQIRFPVPECWIYLFRTEKHFRYGSKKSTARRPGKIKGLERIIGAAQNLDQSLIEVSAGQAKYEHVFHAVVWRIPRLPKEGQGAYTQQLFLLRTELTSFDQIPESFEQFVDVEFTMPATYVSHTTVRSVSVTNPIPPEKYVRYISKHEYKVQIEFKSSSDDIDGLMASPNVSIPVSTTPAVQESTEDEEKDDSD